MDYVENFTVFLMAKAQVNARDSDCSSDSERTIEYMNKPHCSSDGEETK